MSTKGIRIPIEFLAQLDESQAVKVEERLAQLFEERSLDIGTDEAEAHLERVLGLMTDAKQAAAGIEVSASTADITRKLSDAAALIESLGDADIDISVSDAFISDIRILADEYDRVQQESQAVVDMQTKALAAMRLAGQQGTDAYRKLAGELGDARARLQDIADAVAAPEPGFLQKLFGGPDGGINFLALSEGAAQVEEVFTGIIEKGTEYKDAYRAVQVQTGATAEEMERFQSIARRAFSAGVGEGPAEALKNVGTTVQLFGKGLTDGALEELTVGLGGAAKAFEKEFSEVAGRAATFQKSFKTSSAETVGLITLALQGARTPADDVLDTIGEYSPLMEQAGFSAREFIGILTTAGGGAAFNTDKLADSIKETGIRLKEGDITVALNDLVANFSDRVPSALMASLNGIAEAGAAGSKTVKDVLLESTREIERAYAEGSIDENIRKKLQSSFAGTPAEEFGADLYARAFGAPIDENLIAARAAAAQATLETSFYPGIAEKVGRAFDFVEQRAAAVFLPLAKAGAAVADMAPKFAAIKSALPDSVVKNLETSITNAAGKGMDLLTGKLGGVQTLLKGLGPALLGPWGIAIGAATGLLALFFTQTEAGQEIWQSIVDGVTSFYDMAKPALDAIMDTLGAAGTLFYELFIAQFEIASDVMGGVLDLVMSLFSSGDETGADGLKEFFASLAAGAEQAEVFIRGIIAAFRSLRENVGAALKALVTGDISGFLDAIGTIGDETSVAFQSGIDDAARDLKVEHLQKRVSSALEIKGDLDENDALGKLVAKYTSATDEMTRRNLAGQIAQEVPGAVTGLTTVVDAATGEVQELYDISLEKAQAFVDGQNRVLSEQLGSGQDAFIALLSEQSEMVDEQKDKLQALADQIVETGKRGGDTSRLTEEYNKQRDAVQQQAEALRSAVVQGKGLGITAQNIQEVAQRAGKTTEEATRLGASFVEAKKKTDDLSHSAKVLGDTFKQALSGIDGQLSTAIGAASGAQLQIQNLRKELKTTTDTDRRAEIEREIARYQKDYIGNRTKAVALGREQVNLQQLEANIQRDVAKGQESSLVRGQRSLDQLGKNIELTTRLFDLRQREEQIRAGRDTNAFDELRRATFELQNQEAVLDALIAKYRVPKELARALFDELRKGTKDVDVNALAIKVGLRAEEKDGRFDLKAEVLQQFANVYENELNVLDIRTRIGREGLDPSALLDLTRQIEEQRFTIELELGLKTNVDLAERIGGQIDAVQSRAAALQADIDALNAALAGENQNEETRLQNAARLLDLQRQLAELTLSEGELRASQRAAYAAMQDERIAKVQETYDRELALATRRFDNEQTLAVRFIDTYEALSAATTEERRDRELEAVEEVLAARLSAIDEETAQREQQLGLLEEYGLLGEEGIDTERKLMDRRLAIQREAEERRRAAEAQAQAEREALEREAQKRLLVQEQQAAGERLAVEARRARAELELERDKLQEEQRLRREKALLTGDQNELRLAEGLGRQLDDLNKQIEEKGALTMELTGSLGTGLADAFAGLFASNEERMKDAFRGTFSVLAGALKKLASSFVIDIVLQSPWIKGLIALNPFLGAGITATATGVLTGLVNAILNPILGSLLSFSTGGRVDRPTLAVVGDASRLGGRDREWWMRDEQLWGIVSAATAAQTAVIREGLSRIEAAIRDERIVGQLAGSVMYLLTQSGQQEIQRRQRG